jgi:hypothetical protein
MSVQYLFNFIFRVTRPIITRKFRRNGTLFFTSGVFDMTLQEAKNLVQGSLVHHVSKRNADGTPMRAKVLSVRTWKRSPDRVLVSLKHGLYDYAKFDEREIDQLVIPS